MSSAPAALARPAAVLARGAAAAGGFVARGARQQIGEPAVLGRRRPAPRRRSRRRRQAAAAASPHDALRLLPRGADSSSSARARAARGERGGGGGGGGAAAAAGRRRGLEAAARGAAGGRDRLGDVIGAARARDDVGQLVERLHLLADDAAQRGGLLGRLARQFRGAATHFGARLLELALDLHRHAADLGRGGGEFLRRPAEDIRQLVIGLLIGRAQRRRRSPRSRARRRRARRRNARRRDRRCRCVAWAMKPPTSRARSSTRRKFSSTRPEKAATRLLEVLALVLDEQHQALQRATARVERGVELGLALRQPLGALRQALLMRLHRADDRAGVAHHAARHFADLRDMLSDRRRSRPGTRAACRRAPCRDWRDCRRPPR